MRVKGSPETRLVAGFLSETGTMPTLRQVLENDYRKFDFWQSSPEAYLACPISNMFMATGA